MSSDKTFYITTSIPYVNSRPHIGNILDSIYADVLARCKRAQGFDTWFLTGTDEHGAKIARSAEAAGTTPREFVDENFKAFRALKELLNLSWDDFIRTSDAKRHFPAAQKIWELIRAKGDLYEKEYQGLYCVGHEAFITEKDLVDGKCIDHQKAPELVKEKNWFFRLSKYSEEIESRIMKHELRVVPETREHEILSLIREGLEDVSFSRPAKDLSWGVPVPGDPTQTMYVWCEALVNYISALGYASDDDSKYKKYWPADVHMVGKDNLRFHAAIWPGMLLSAGIELPKAVYVHGFVNVDGKKISKTVGNVIDPYELVKKYGVDSVRYYLLREFSPAEDGDFTYKKFEERYNADLASGLGNLHARVFTLASRTDFSGGVTKKLKDASVEAEIKKTRAAVNQEIGAFRFHEALKLMWDLIGFADRYLNTAEPWKKSVGEARGSLLNAVMIIDVISGMIFPFLPGTAEKIAQGISWGDNSLRVTRSESLFPRLQ